MMADQARSRRAIDILLTVLRNRKSRCPGKMVDVLTHIVPCPHRWGDTTFEKIGIKPRARVAATLHLPSPGPLNSFSPEMKVPLGHKCAIKVD
jgi:hypothetical protein